MACSTSRLVGLAATDLDYRGVVAGRPALYQALIAARRRAAKHADGVKLVHDLRHRHELGHRAKGLTPEVGIRAGEDHAAAAGRQRRREVHDGAVEELRLVNGNDLRYRIETLSDLRRRIDRNRLHHPPVVTGDGVDPGVAPIEV